MTKIPEPDLRPELYCHFIFSLFCQLVAVFLQANAKTAIFLLAIVYVKYL